MFSSPSVSGTPSSNDSVFENKIGALKKLLAKRFINVPESWIRSSERQSEMDGVKTYDRWLKMDIRKIDGIDPGPFARLSQSIDINTELKDSYALQVVDCWDSSEPRNKQTSDLLETNEERKSDDESDDDDTGRGRGRGGKTTRGGGKPGKGRGFPPPQQQNQFFKRGPKLLAMILTNGACEVKVAEFEAVPEWRNAMPLTPGSKVLLKGPLRADTNVIFISSQNFQLLHKAPNK